jgi:predicted component of type VI protein secretion system
MTLDEGGAVAAARDWIQQIEALPKAVFASRYAWWFLIGRSPMQPSPPLMSTISTRVPNVVAAALQRHETQSVPVVKEPRPDQGPTVYTRIVRAVHKRTELFANMITIGRTANNDIHLADASVSKFHAYFHVDDTVRIVDAGSHNGTRVDDVRCPPKTAVPVHAGSRIELGRINLTLVSAEACWEAIRSVGEPPAKR